MLRGIVLIAAGWKRLGRVSFLQDDEREDGDGKKLNGLL